MGNLHSGRKRKRPGKGAGGAGKAKGAEARDALGRWLRAERRRINALKAKRMPLDASGHHPVIAAGPKMAKEIREEKKLSVKAAAELAEMSAPGLKKFEEGKGGGKSDTVGFVCRGYGILVSAFYRRIEKKKNLRPRHEG
jgi:hypothetical protein